MNKLRKLTLGAAVSFALGTGSSFAATVTSQLFDGFQRLSDNSAERIEGDQAVGVAGHGILEVNERLRGIFRIENTTKIGPPNEGNQNEFSPTNNQLAGIFDLTVIRKIPDPSLTNPNQTIFVFRP